MELYHTQTREDYNAFIDELESKCVKWRGGQKIREFDGFEMHGSEAVLKLSGNVISCYSMDFYKKNYNDFEIIEYKAKKDVKDLNESVLKIIENLAQATNLKSFYSLQKAKYNLDKLIEKWEVEDDTKI